MTNLLNWYVNSFIRSNIQAIWDSWHNPWNRSFILDFVDTEEHKTMTLTKSSDRRISPESDRFSPRTGPSEIVETLLRDHQKHSGDQVRMSWSPGFGKFCVREKAGT